MGCEQRFHATSTVQRDSVGGTWDASSGFTLLPRSSQIACGAHGMRAAVSRYVHGATRGATCGATRGATCGATRGATRITTLKGTTPHTGLQQYYREGYRLN